jgi:lipopolysaccharide heptosyltransferase II
MRTLRRVLIVHPYGIGDLLFVTPVLRALRLIPTVEKVDLLIGSRTRKALESNPHVDEIFVVDKDLFHARKTSENFRECFELGRKLRKNRYDLMIDFSLRREYAFGGQWLLKIPRRAGFDYRGRAFFHNIRLRIPEGFHGRSVTDFYCDLAELAGIPVEDRFLEFYLTDRIRDEAAQWLKKEGCSDILTVAPGGGESWGKDADFKRWPARFFADLINRLRGRLVFDRVVILGTEQEAPLGGEIKRLLEVECLDCTGKLPLEMAAALLERSRLFVGNDGGLVHMAHALRTPIIAFFGPVDPVVYGPYPPSSRAWPVYREGLPCRPCYRKFRYRADCREKECLRDLTPALVLEAAEKRKFFDPIKICGRKG